MTTDPARLEALAARLDAGGDIDSAERRLLALMLRATVDHRPAVAVAVGEARRRRDDMLREIRAGHYTDATASGAAKALAMALARYESGAWRVDRGNARPPGKPGSLARAFDALAAGEACRQKDKAWLAWATGSGAAPAK